MVEKTAAFRQRRAADTARWRERLQRGMAVYPVEIDGMTFDLMEKFAELDPKNTNDRQAVAVALGKLWQLAIAARFCGKSFPGVELVTRPSDGAQGVLSSRNGQADQLANSPRRYPARR